MFGEWEDGRTMRISNVRVRRRLFMVLVASFFIFTAMLIRLGYVQLWIGSTLSEEAEDSWRRNIPFSAKRGDIIDRNGVAFTYNISSPSVLAIPAQVKDPERTAKLLAQTRSEEHTSELQSRENLLCRHLLEKKDTRNVGRRALSVIAPT